MRTALVWTLGALLLAGTGCPGPEPPPPPSALPKALVAVPRSAVPNIYTFRGAFGWSIPNVMVGDVVGVVGHDLEPDAQQVTVTLGASADTEIPCPVLGYTLIDAQSVYGRLGALFIEIPGQALVAPAQQLRVRVDGAQPNSPQTVGVHRPAYASAAAGNAVYALDVSIQPPAWVGGRDFNLPATADTLAVSADGRFAFCSTGRDLRVVLLADGQLLLTATGLFNGPVGPLVVARDGRTLIAGVTPPAPAAAELAVVDVSSLAALSLSVSPATGLITPASAVTAIPPATTIGLGGPVAGTLALRPDSARCYATLSNGVVREFQVNGPTNVWALQDIVLPAGTTPFGCALSPNGTRLLVTDIVAGRCIPIDLPTQRVFAALTTGPTPLAPVLNRDGTRAVVFCAGGQSASLFNLTPGLVTPHSPSALLLGFAPGESTLAPGRPFGTPDGDLVLVADGNQVRFCSVDTTTGAIVLELWSAGPFPQAVRKLAVSGR